MKLNINTIQHTGLITASLMMSSHNMSDRD
jgi:hypothetical protein